MSQKRRPNAARDAFSFAGGVSGLVVFLIALLQGALAYGGAAGVAVTHGLGLPAPGESTLALLIVWVGMLLGAAATAAVTIILGAMVGALVYGLIGRHFMDAPQQTTEEEQR